MPTPPSDVAPTPRSGAPGGWLERVLGSIERVGNALPHPASLFAILAGLVVLSSAVAASLAIEVTHPGTGETVRPVSLLTLTGMHRMLTEAVRNFTGFAPLGTVLVAMLKASGLGGLPLMFGFVLTTAFLNLFMGSASARWAVMAPVFVPMFMLVGYTPQLTQTAYRIGDSVSNVVPPMMSYFAPIVAFVEKYDKKAGIGTVIATMLPYTMAFLICWSLLLLGWMALGFPVGPGAGLRLAPGM